MDNTPFLRRHFLQAGAGAVAGLAGISPASGAVSGAPGEYSPSWESLDAHACPAWFRDAKIGLYFHWGLSSVPGWAPRDSGTPYAEWYWNSMREPKNPTYRYHRETYGEKFEYDDFIPRFKADRYRPEEWVDLAKRSGAKYLFVNAKHHDGFCLWPTRRTRRNARDLGPKRDLVGPLEEATRRAGLKFGFYYSFYEWYNPLYTGKVADYTGLVFVRNYVDDFMVPQVRELIDRYHPDFLYFDGEWDQVADYWKSRDLVAYYYNQAARRGQDVLVNDRYGKGERGKHGDVYNVEYQYDTGNEGLLDNAWSYWRGIAKTFGWNRDTDPEDCLSTRDLIHMAVNGIARNGNFDINVGPDAGGAIIDLERTPLLGLGNWLGVNGEAIYGGHPWKVQAEGDIRFTAKGEYVYAIFLKWPGEQFSIKSLRAETGSSISMLGIPGQLDWKQDDSGLTVLFPLHKSRPSGNAYAWTLKIKAS